jgi:hypothetical protein
LEKKMLISGLISLLLENTLGNKMKNLSKQLNLSKLYTNHSLRATTITLLDNKGLRQGT